MPLMNDRPRFAVRPPRAARPGALQTLPATPQRTAARIAHPAYAPFWGVVNRHLAAAKAFDLTGAGINEIQRGACAKALALRAWATASARDANLARKAVLAAGAGNWPGWPGMADVIMDFVLAADLLRAMGRFAPHAMAELRDRLTPKIEEAFGCADDLPQNNWRIEADCTSAMAGLFFWHAPGALNVRELLGSGLDGISRMLFGLLTPDGANEEGINYSRRGAIPVVRLAWAYRHMAGVDLLNHPLLRRWHRWQVEVKRPDGKMWPMDDGDDGYELYPHVLLANPRYRDAGLQRWAHERAPLAKEEWAAEAMLLFDHTVKPKPPTWHPSYVLKESGTAFFRSGWDKDATMAILVARPFSPFGADQINSAHKHDDQTSFLIHARGALLATEGGYGHGHAAARRYDYFLAGAAHNMVLVDGAGPLRITSHNSDAREGNTSQSAGRVAEICAFRDLYGAQALTSYHNVDFRRNMFMVRKRYFVIVDEVEAPRTHVYSWILHGNSLEAATAQPCGERWIVGAARLSAFHLFPAAMPWRHIKCFGTGQKGDPPRRISTEHMYTRTWTSGRNVTFLTVVVPDDAAASMPQVGIESSSPMAVRIKLQGMKKSDIFVWSPAQRKGVKVGDLGRFDLRGPADVFAVP